MPASTLPEHAPSESFIQHARDKHEVWFEEGCYITEWLNDPADPAVSIARARVLAGTSTRWHHLPALRERYIVLEGQGEIEIAGLPATILSAGDCVSIAPGAAQRIHNRGHIDLIFLAICTPRFEPHNYVDGR